ncbi:MAG: hypothetical protein ABL974_04845 [Prosthecobacter sp.]
MIAISRLLRVTAVSQAFDQAYARKQITSHNQQFAIDPVDSKHMYWGVCGMI